MYLLLLLAVAALALDSAGSQSQADLAGTWVRESMAGAAAGAGAGDGWGPEFTATLRREVLTVEWRAPGRTMSRSFRLDGEPAPERRTGHCSGFTEVTSQATWKGQTLVITETGRPMVCTHGISGQSGPVSFMTPRPTERGLISVTTIAMPTPDRLVLEIVRAGGPAGTSTIELVYRRKTGPA